MDTPLEKWQIAPSLDFLDSLMPMKECHQVFRERASLVPEPGMLRPAELIVHPNGAVAHVSEFAQEWLANELFVTPLHARLRKLEADSESTAGEEIRPLNAATRIVRLEGPDGVRYLVTVAPLGVAQADPSGALSPREREVAAGAVAGATAAEIARTLGSSQETVRTQLKAIYRKLDVSSRIELARALLPSQGS